MLLIFQYNLTFHLNYPNQHKASLETFDLLYQLLFSFRLKMLQYFDNKFHKQKNDL